MATISNLEEAAADFLESAEFENLGEGVQLASLDGISAFTSSTSNIDLTSSTGRTTNDVSDNAVLTGDADLDVIGNTGDNIIVGNDGSNDISADDGNDQLITGDGDDNISLGAGDDTVEITGSGNKIIDGGDGDDTFIITPDGAGSNTIFTGLTIGDTLRINADFHGNQDGVIDFADVDLDETDAGDVIFNLTDGTSFTLEGVTKEQAMDGTIKYEITTDDDGNITVELSA